VPEARARCHALLYSRGLALSASSRPAAHPLLASALFFSPPGGPHARTARLLASCCAACGQRAAALQYLSHAARHEAPAGRAAPAEELLLELRTLCALLAQEAEEGAARQPAGCGGGSEAGSPADGQAGEEGEQPPGGNVWRRVCKAAAALPAAKLASGSRAPATGAEESAVMQVRCGCRGGACVKVLLAARMQCVPRS
jgi:hypothetical protein